MTVQSDERVRARPRDAGRARRDGDRRRGPGGPRRRVPPGPARPPVRDPRRQRAGSATPGASAGTRCACSRPPATTACRGCRSPAPPWSFPDADEMADYLEGYAARFELPVRGGVRVDGLGTARGRFVLAAGERRFEADQVVLASGPFQRARIPAFAPELDPRVVQLHSSEYRNPSQLREGGVLVVAPGNSGADIALDVAGGRPTWISGRAPGAHPARTPRARPGGSPSRSSGSSGRTCSTSARRSAAGPGRRSLAGPEPLIRVKPKDLAAAGVERVARTAGVRDGRPVLEDGRVMDVENVIWCTGYRQDLGVDRPRRLRGRDGAGHRARRGRLAAGPVPRRARVPLRVQLPHGRRRRPRRRAHRGAHRPARGCGRHGLSDDGGASSASPR